MAERIVIDPRFHGPPTSGHGGYTSGLVGTRIDGPAEVTLRVPPPLDRPLELTRDGDGLILKDGDTVVAEAAPTTVDEHPPATVSLDEAEDATRRYAGFERHLFPTCFVCGPRRPPGEGLRLFAGAVPDREVAATPWIPDPEFADDEGQVWSEVVWASLDCPSYWGGVAGPPAMLGRLAADIRAPLVAGRPYIVLGWGRGSDGRKHYAASAVTDPHGKVLAVGRSTWIELGEPPAAAG